MTDIERSGQTTSSEGRYRKNRRSSPLYLFIALTVLGVAASLSGLMARGFIDGIVPMWMPIACPTAIFGGFVWFTIDYYRGLDQIDLMDNLWPHMAGVYIAR
ncbi:MAG: hypothetical protein WA948_01660 [Pontixanthobacter sp.]